MPRCTPRELWRYGFLVLGLAATAVVHAHGVAGDDAAFVASNQGVQIIPFLYLGAKHMVTGYDHLLFIFGVIFFLYRLSHVALYVTMFSIGHSITLLAGVLGGDPRQSLSDRRHHRPVGRVQGLRQPQRVQEVCSASSSTRRRRC